GVDESLSFVDGGSGQVDSHKLACRQGECHGNQIPAIAARQLEDPASVHRSRSHSEQRADRGQTIRMSLKKWIPWIRNCVVSGAHYAPAGPSTFPCRIARLARCEALAASTPARTWAFGRARLRTQSSQFRRFVRVPSPELLTTISGSGNPSTRCGAPSGYTRNPSRVSFMTPSLPRKTIPPSSIELTMVPLYTAVKFCGNRIE